MSVLFFICYQLNALSTEFSFFNISCYSYYHRCEYNAVRGSMTSISHTQSTVPPDNSASVVFDNPVTNDLTIPVSASFIIYQGPTFPGNQHDLRCLIDSRNQNSACNHVNFSASQNFTMRSSSDHVSQVNTDSQPVDFREFLLGKLDLNSPTELKHNYVAAIIGKSNQTEHSMDCNYKETYALVPRVLDVNGKHQAKLGL